ncbi:MAG: bifunctional riboflavin kinase/FAD synthetase [Actinomycetota bacterium]|nr:bifunctional riboflavin kinase/FAD synthetase [Actinomycetota bacterium]
MNLVTELSSFTPPPVGTAVSIGAYDGVHLGHRAVLRELRRLARLGGHETVVVTFDRHPASVVRPDSAPLLLTDLDQKLEVMAATGDVDHVVVVPFNEARAREEASDFVREVLIESLRARLVVVGEDFHFGRGRRGNVGLLHEMGAEAGFEVVGLPLVGSVSSTRIRELLRAGDVAAASTLLGRVHEVRGIVVRGDGRGRELGFPTANIEVPGDILLPRDGIYAGWYERPDGSVRAAAMSLGVRPMFPTQAPLLEAYVLDFEGDLYGEAAKARFVERLRDEEKFDSIDLLVDQITKDVAATRATLGA